MKIAFVSKNNFIRGKKKLFDKFLLDLDIINYQCFLLDDNIQQKLNYYIPTFVIFVEVEDSELPQILNTDYFTIPFSESSLPLHAQKIKRYISNYYDKQEQEIINKKFKGKKILIKKNETYKLKQIPATMSPVCFDVESTGLDIYGKDKLDGYSFYYGDGNAYYIQHSDDNLKELFRLLSASELIIAHNIVFDMKWLKKHSMYPYKNDWFCTQTAAHLLDEYRRKGLKYLSKHLLNYEMTELSSITHGQNNASLADPQKLAEYACDDVIQTFRLYELFRIQLEKESLEDLFYNIEMPFQQSLIEMESNGVLFEADKIKHLNVQILKEIKRVKNEISNHLPSKYLQPSLFSKEKIILLDLDSPQQLARFLFEDLKLKIIERGKSGQPSTGSKILKRIKNKHPVIPFIIEYKELMKLYSSYITSLPKFIKPDGRIHCDFNNCGTKTGRLSSARPNLQQLPNNENIDIRSCFISSPGYKMIAIDYGQEELRVGAHVSNDEGFIDVYKKQLDVHLNTADKVFNLGLSEQELKDGTPEHTEAKNKHNKLRKFSKFINFGLLFGAGDRGLADLINIPVDEAKKMRDNFFNSFPNVKDEINNTEYLVNRYGFVRNLYGRKRRFVKIHGQYAKKSYREAFNFRIQGSCADILRVACNRILNFIRDNNNECRMLMSIHDEVVFEVPEDKVKFYIDNIKQIMEYVITLRVPLVTDAGVGDNYSEAK